MKPDWSRKPDWAIGHAVVKTNKAELWFNDDQYQYLYDGRIFTFDKGGLTKTDLKDMRYPPEESKPKLKPDWSKKPEWADVWIEDKRNSRNSGWHKDNGDEFTDAHERHYIKFSIDANEAVTVYYPPKETKPEWNGEGLPPIGFICIVEDTNPHESYAKFVGREVRIVAHDEDSHGTKIAVFSCKDEDGYNDYHALASGCFRPIKSDKEKWLDAAGDLLNNMQPHDDFLSLLYDAMILGEIPIPKKEPTNEPTI